MAYKSMIYRCTTVTSSKGYDFFHFLKILKSSTISNKKEF
jgi:hypothetical protein